MRFLCLLFSAVIAGCAGAPSPPPSGEANPSTASSTSAEGSAEQHAEPSAVDPSSYPASGGESSEAAEELAFGSTIEGVVKDDMRWYRIKVQPSHHILVRAQLQKLGSDNMSSETPVYEIFDIALEKKSSLMHSTSSTPAQNKFDTHEDTMDPYGAGEFYFRVRCDQCNVPVHYKLTLTEQPH